MLQAATLLVAADFDVEVAALSAGALQEAYQKINVTTHIVSSDRTPCGLMKEAERLWEQQKYIGVVWGVTHFFEAYQCAQPLPGAFSVLWVLEDHWPEAVEPVGMDWTNVLRFDYVAFWTAETMAKHAALINPTGHLPISFAVLNHTPAVHPSMAFPIQRMANALLQRHAGVNKPQAGRRSTEPKAGQPPSGIVLNPANLAVAYDMPETCPHNWFSKLAVMVHLGRHKADRLGILFPAIMDNSLSVHLWVTYTHMHNRREVLNLRHRRNRTRGAYHPLMVRDHGLDLGPFFTLLWQVARCRYRYSFVLKYHFKSDATHDFARQAALFWTQPGFLGKAIRHLERHPNVSAVYGRIRGTRDLTVNRSDFWFFGFGRPYIKEIQATIPVPIPDGPVLVGSVWLARMCSISHWLRSTSQLWAIYSGLNDPMGVDWRWYSRRVIGAECNQSAALRHYYYKGRKENQPPNSYAPIPGFFTSSRDGLIEHAWERFFSFMFSSYGPFEALFP
eukprot:EG_transcript_8378